MSPRKASSGLRIRGSSAGSAPSCDTFQFFMSMPFGTYRKARRTGAFGAAANAGTIESRNGSATVAPTPLRKVLRGSDLPVTIMRPSLIGSLSYRKTGSRGLLSCVGRGHPRPARAGVAARAAGGGRRRRFCRLAARQADHRLFSCGASPAAAARWRAPAVACGTVLDHARVGADRVAFQVLLAGVREILSVAQRRIVHLDDRVLVARVILAPAGEAREIVVAHHDDVDAVRRGDHVGHGHTFERFDNHGDQHVVVDRGAIVDAGLVPQLAIRAATGAPASEWGIPGEPGRIARLERVIY